MLVARITMNEEPAPGKPAMRMCPLLSSSFAYDCLRYYGVSSYSGYDGSKGKSKGKGKDSDKGKGKDGKGKDSKGKDGKGKGKGKNKSKKGKGD